MPVSALCVLYLSWIWQSWERPSGTHEDSKSMGDGLSWTGHFAVDFHFAKVPFSKDLLPCTLGPSPILVRHTHIWERSLNVKYGVVTCSTLREVGGRHRAVRLGVRPHTWVHGTQGPQWDGSPATPVSDLRRSNVHKVSRPRLNRNVPWVRHTAVRHSMSRW